MTGAPITWAEVGTRWQSALSANGLELAPNGPEASLHTRALLTLCAAVARRAGHPGKGPPLAAALAVRYGLEHHLELEAAAAPPHELWAEALRGPHHRALLDALHATAICASGEATETGDRTIRALHPTGVTTSAGTETCGGCAWLFMDEAQQTRCRHRDAHGAATPTVQREWPACYRFETPREEADCMACGACCREGFHVVPVEPDEPLQKVGAHLLVRDDQGAHVPRPLGKCAALTSGKGPPWTCSVYDNRPRACRNFAADGPHCLTARQRVGLSPP